MTKKIALVCDWLTNVGGAERVLLTLHQMYPEAPIYTSQYRKKGIDWFKDADVRTGWLQPIPAGLRRFIAPLRQFYFSRLDLTDYDIVISVTGAEAKFVKTEKNRTQESKTEQPEHHTTHLCYCHVPTQYYWQMYDTYLENPGFGILNPLARLGLKLLIKPLRKRDYAASQRTDQFITISTYAAEQIKKYYNRESVIIHPPVNLEKFAEEQGNTSNLSTPNTDFSTIENNKKGKSQIIKQHKIKKNQTQSVENSVDKTRSGFITTSRQVNWKRLDICIEACIATKTHLTIIGEGPEHNNLVKLANNSEYITFLPQMDQSELAKHLRSSEAYLFPSLEPFGIAPVEALAAGCPVIAYGEGGALDYIISEQNGLTFKPQTAKSLAEAIKYFNQLKSAKKKPAFLNPNVVKNTTLKFGEGEFIRKIQELVDEKS